VAAARDGAIFPLRHYNPPVQTILATPAYGRAIGAVAELLTKLRIDFLFLGNVARAAWLGGTVDQGSIDILAVMQPPQKNQLARMAGNRGFVVDRDEIAQSEELDLVPLRFVDHDGDIRVHVLLASNALYGRMFGAAVATQIGEQPLRVPAAEDLALLLAMADDHGAVQTLTESGEFDRRLYNDKLTSIGLRELAIRD
jgi:hypothetical protein